MTAGIGIFSGITPFGRPVSTKPTEKVRPDTGVSPRNIVGRLVRPAAQRAERASTEE